MALEKLISPLPGIVVEIKVKAQQLVSKGQPLLVVEAMKMENAINCTADGIVQQLLVKEGDVISKGQVLMLFQRRAGAAEIQIFQKEIDLDHISEDLKALQDRTKNLLDESRPAAVAKRRAKGQLTARENIALLCDEDSFFEYGGFTVAAQRSRRTEEDLIKNTPADGLVTGTASINKTLFEGKEQPCLVMAYDYTVLAGTQGMFNHFKMDRMLTVAAKNKLPIVLFAEGGGGRPGDVDVQTIAGLHIMTFFEYAKLEGVVPRISIVSGYCFAGNAALAGTSDIIIATANTSIGMGGPAMVEGGGLGRFHPQEIGPAEVQSLNGVIDILVADEPAAILVAKQYLSYFQGNVLQWEAEDQRLLRQLVPANRKSVFDIRKVIATVADKGSVLEIGGTYAKDMYTGLIRVEGRAMGVIANDAQHQAGAITSEGAEKAARLLTLCDQFDIPILSLVDTPGIMVGPEAEKSGTVKHAAKLFTTGARLKVPFFAIVLRRGYGLGAMAMTRGSFHAADFIVSWPSAEFGAMGLEGAIRLGYSKELAAITDPEQREAAYEQMLAQAYERGKPINMAAFLEIDGVIDPADSRAWLLSGLNNRQNTKKSS
ncbi:MAG: carboxyl transferase domain-containing protein [Saprospiraceae bacterium]